MKTQDEIRLPDGTVDLVRDLVPAVRRLLGRGLSDDFLRSCVRIGGFQCFGGGLKASLVGGLRIDVNAVIKLGGADLELHQRLMNAVNAVRPRTFPTILDRVEVAPGRHLLLMEDLRKYSTLLDLIYRDGLPEKAMATILDKTLDALVAIRETGTRQRSQLADIPVNPEPFFDRLRDKLRAALTADPALEPLLGKPGCVLGVPCPPVNELLEKARAFLGRISSQAAANLDREPARASLARPADTLSPTGGEGRGEGAKRMSSPMRSFRPVLEHGDPHLGNVMVRAYGHGWSVRLIDPNPEVGFTDPLYDVGKLFHWAEPVGWAHVAPEVCRADWRCGRSGWELEACHRPADATAERRREHLVARLRERIHRLVPGEPADSLCLRLPLAIAAAHVGLAALLKGDTQRTARRFVLAHTLRHLAEWHATTDRIAP